MFRYKVTQDDYLKMVKYLMKEKRNRPFGILKLLFLTVIQMGLVALFLIKAPELEAWMKWVLIAISLIVAGLAVFQNFFFDLRAKMVLEQRARQDPKGTFWMEHKLSLHENIVRVVYGDQKAEIDARQVSGVVRLDDISLIRMGWNIFEVVPKSVTDRAEWADFEKQLLNRKYEVAELEVEDACRKVLEKAQFQQTVTIGEEELVDTLVRMKRLSYGLLCGWSNKDILKLGLPILIVVYAVTLKDPLYIGLAVLSFLLFNMNLFLTFTPYCRKTVRSALIQPREDGSYLLAVTANYVYLFGRYQSFRYERKDLKKIVESKDKLFLYFTKQRMVFAPADQKERLIAVLQGRGGLSEKAKMGS